MLTTLSKLVARAHPLTRKMRHEVSLACHRSIGAKQHSNLLCNTVTQNTFQYEWEFKNCVYVKEGVNIFYIFHVQSVKERVHNK